MAKGDIKSVFRKERKLVKRRSRLPVRGTSGGTREVFLSLSVRSVSLTPPKTNPVQERRRLRLNVWSLQLEPEAKINFDPTSSKTSTSVGPPVSSSGRSGVSHSLSRSPVVLRLLVWTGSVVGSPKVRDQGPVRNWT